LLATPKVAKTCFNAARYGLKRLPALHDNIACLQGSETSADRLADERMYYCGLLEKCELGLKLQTGNQGRWLVSPTACIPTTLMDFAECDIATNFANADSIEHCFD
jgi:hypothetical protein